MDKQEERRIEQEEEEDMDMDPREKEEVIIMKKKKKHRFVLVHGPCDGGWTWYKVATLLASAGHRVTALDMSGGGVNPSRIEEVQSFNDYARPLTDAIASIPSDAEEDKVILVGHGYGGYALSLAMEKFPSRISVAVFAAALMPKLCSSPATTLDEFYKRDHIESMMDCHFSFDQDQENYLTSYTYGPKFMASMMYQCCPAQDVTLATLMARPSKLYLEDLSDETMLSKANYGSVNRVYIVCKQDKLYTEDYQRWIIENNPPKEMKEIEGSDHMVMLSKPQELCHCLLEIAEKYA